MNKRLWAILVKAKAGYHCARCGSAEFLQAHDPTGRHIAVNDGICLCAKCHSKEHPNIPENFFTSKNHQPYWHNLSASSLAGILNRHPRTIWRWARKLKIPKGYITYSQIQEIKTHLHNEHHLRHPTKKFKLGAFLGQKYKVRKSTASGGHEISLPPAWIEARGEDEEVEVLYDSLVVVIVPTRVKVNERVLSGAFEEK